MVLTVVNDHKMEGESDEGVHGGGRNEVEVESNEVEGVTKLNKFN